MDLDAWLTKVQERQRTALAGLGTFQQQVERGLQQLQSSLDESQRRMDEREPGRVQRMVASLDVDGLLEKMNGRRYSELSPRERRVVPSFWRKVQPVRMAEFLEQFPDGWSRLVRQRLRDWCLADADSMHLREWTGLTRRCPKDLPSLRWRLPVPIELALEPEGPRSVAAGWGAHPLREVVSLLGQAGLRPSIGYAGHVVAEHLLRQCVAREDVSESLLFLVDSQEGRAWLPGVSGGGSVLGAPVEARVAVVATLLECRARGRVGKDVQARVEERLVARDSVFGDPRLSTLTEAWSAVRKCSKQAFDAFLSALIQQDLEFFFEKAMNERDRHAFWLRYLGVIQSTTCWLAPDTYDALQRSVRTLPLEQQAAFRRARRLAKGDVSAFCLRFSEYSVVEFSDTGNATYVYGHSVFSGRVLGGGVESANDLKVRREAKDRLHHHSNWEPRFEQALLELGIERKPPGPKRSS
ncbi:EH signature domain-containing protein [Myxococcus sp. K38C18041901]|uniref:EH signature domain-containing protein n=1 Tax=Myxococcus guangdongensis TaxID=2906760 RepID=UPI0020A70C9F|nr:EH signature domain-containing protein [Myxococcus guangdongensis]MCP3061110.1 EH signature domain-containing protein [Myxococcus guangdongensis]